MKISNRQSTNSSQTKDYLQLKVCIEEFEIICSGRYEKDKKFRWNAKLKDNVSIVVNQYISLQGAGSTDAVAKLAAINMVFQL